MPTTFRIVTGHDALVGLVAADGVRRPRPRPGRPRSATGPGSSPSHSATSPAAKMFGSSVRMRSSTITPRLIRSFASLARSMFGLMPAATSRIWACRRRPSARSTPRRRPLASTERDLGVEHDLEAEAFEVGAQQLAAALVELAARAGGWSARARWSSGRACAARRRPRGRAGRRRRRRRGASRPSARRRAGPSRRRRCAARRCRERRSPRSAGRSCASRTRGSGGRSRASRPCRARPARFVRSIHSARVFSHVVIARSSYQASGLR